MLCFRKFPVAKKFMDERWGGSMTIFSQNFFGSLPKSFVGEPVSVSIFSGIEKFCASEGYVTIFCRNLFVSQCQKISWGNPFVCH